MTEGEMILSGSSSVSTCYLSRLRLLLLLGLLKWYPDSFAYDYYPLASVTAGEKLVSKRSLVTIVGRDVVSSLTFDRTGLLDYYRGSPLDLSSGGASVNVR